MEPSILPKRWHVYVVDLSPRVRSKPGKQRPCLAIQPDEAGQGGLKSTVVIPLTSQVVGDKAFPLRVHIPQGTCLLEKGSDLIIDQILAWDNSLFREDLGEIPVSLQEKARQALKEFLDLE